jgi:cell division septum initiation protein DivIVA
MVFPSAKLGRRGLDEMYVRAFCAKVEEEIVFLLNERATLYQQAEELRQRFRDAEDAEPRYAPGVAHLQAVQILTSAQKTAERFVSEAQDYCRELAENGRQRRDQMLTEARRDAAKMLERADSEARSVAADAAVRATPGEHEDLQEEIAYLRMFSEVYRTHLRAYLEALMRNLDEWARAEQSPAGNGISRRGCREGKSPISPMVGEDRRHDRMQHRLVTCVNSGNQEIRVAVEAHPGAHAWKSAPDQRRAASSWARKIEARTARYTAV